MLLEWSGHLPVPLLLGSAASDGKITCVFVRPLLLEVHRQPQLSEKDVKVLRSLLPKLINNYSSHTTRMTSAV